MEVACDQPFARVTYEPTTLVVGASTPTIHERAVEGVRDTGREEVVYNCRVAEYHTYFVGDATWPFSIWAHNQGCPYINIKPQWGKNRVIKELHDHGFIFVGRTKSGGGFIYRSPRTGETVRIMPRPNRPRFRNEPLAKFQSEWYYRYRPHPMQPEGPHIPIPAGS